MFGVGAIKEKLEEAKRKAEETKLRLDSVYVEGSSGDYAKVVSTANSKIMQIILNDEATITELLQYYMGKNTPARQEFIINNLKVEMDIVEEADPQAA